jgi:hypothetical protein
MATSNQPFDACTLIDATDVGAGDGVELSTPAAWLAEFTADTIFVSVS